MIEGHLNYTAISTTLTDVTQCTNQRQDAAPCAQTEK